MAKQRNGNAPDRKHVTPDEARRLFDAAGQSGRNGARDRTACMMAYYHGLRVAELVGLQWHDVDWKTEQLTVRRVKDGINSTHPIRGDVLRQLRAMKREADGSTGHIFLSERESPLSVDAVQRFVARAGREAGIGLAIHPHMLRHGCGFALANKGVDTRTIQAYLGHAAISSTVIYTALSATRFKNLFRD